MERHKRNMPILVNGTRAWRTYLGGKLLDQRNCHKVEAKDSHFPEEWMFSTTRAINPGREEIVEGLSYLAQQPNISLNDYINNNPRQILGEKHNKRWNGKLGVLVKQIDSAERLTIQVHPDNQTAMQLFHSPFGKTECWSIIETRNDQEEKPCIYLGFKEGITRKEWIDCFEKQDYSRMLGWLHRFEVKPGETYLVRGMMPHAIGSGCLLVEVQEPTDYTIRVERVTPSGQTIADLQCHQGLGFDKMFDCFDYQGMSYEKTKQLCCLPIRKNQNEEVLVDYSDTTCFSMKKYDIEGNTDFEPEEVYYCLYVVKGMGKLIYENEAMFLSPNTQLFVPANSVPFQICNLHEPSLSILKLNGPKCD